MKFKKAFLKWFKNIDDDMMWNLTDDIYESCIAGWEACEKHMAGIESKNCKIAIDALKKYNNHDLWESGSSEGNLDNWCGSLNGFDFAKEALKSIKKKDETTS